MTESFHTNHSKKWPDNGSSLISFSFIFPKLITLILKCFFLGKSGNHYRKKEDLNSLNEVNFALKRF